MSIFESDTISIKSKKRASEHIIARYGDFGWTLTDRKEDKLYGDIVHLTFSRPHCIKNKDELQLMQVRLEIAYNAMGRYSCKIPVRSALSGSLLGLLSLGLATGGAFIFLLLEGYLSIILGVLSCVTAIATGIFCVILTRTLRRRDREKYSQLIEEQIQKIDGLCKRARILRGEDE